MGLGRAGAVVVRGGNTGGVVHRFDWANATEGPEKPSVVVGAGPFCTLLCFSKAWGLVLFTPAKRVHGASHGCYYNNIT